MATTVLVDAWHLGGASANRGIGTYLRGVLPAIARNESIDVVALAPAGVTLPAGARGRTVSRWAPARYAQLEHELRLSRDLARAAREEDADVVLSPADDPPRRSPRPWVQMVHDVIPLVVHDPAFAADARRWQRIGPRVRAADIVCTNSQCTASDATRLLGIDPNRIRVAPLGVDARFSPGGTTSAASDAHAQPSGVPYLLFVGEYGPHKGFAEAFGVIDALVDAGLSHRLTMAGRLAPWHEPTVRALLARASHPERVDLGGYVDDIVATYRNAAALVVTSRYEGFCLPALEAMACGTPVIAFDNSALPEVVGNAGVLVPDGDVAAFARAVRAVLTNDARRSELAEQGIARAREFTWERCADVHVDALRTASERSSR
jgi:glycosyltransferase involved in cell wall biosynthesis